MREEKDMPEHIVTGTTEEERKKELFDYIVKCGWDESRAWAYAVLLGNDWIPELEQNYIEWFNHKPLTDIRVGEITEIMARKPTVLTAG